MARIVRYIVFAACMLFSLVLQAAQLRLEVKDENETPLNDILVYVQGASVLTSITNDEGIAFFDLAPAKYKIHISSIEYESCDIELVVSNADIFQSIVLVRKVEQLAEVRVVASEGKRLSATSTITREAMQHLQPTSLADIMELLPGATTKDPDMGKSASLYVRETGNKTANGTDSEGEGYRTHALGTLFIVDGAILTNNANLQYAQPYKATSSLNTNAHESVDIGVDMRQISTDDIESVEVQRGIPSAEYGNLTSGIVNVRKIRRPTPFTARFKTDGKSTLISAGRGVSISDSKTINADASLLISNIDPRDEYQKYKRVTSSIRFTSKYSSNDYHWQFTPSLDIANNIDNVKQDPQANIKGVDEYKTRYTRIAIASGFMLAANDIQRAFRRLSINVSSSIQLDRLSRRYIVSPTGVSIVPLTSAEGEHNAKFVLSSYDALYTVDGKPFNAAAKCTSDWLLKISSVRNEVKVGAEWTMAKNWGDGQVYDMTMPPSLTEWRTRPRKYADIPAIYTLGLFAQDYISANVGASELNLRLGVRTSSLLGLMHKYVMSGAFYWDPRLNFQWSLPIDDMRCSLSLSLGYGRTSLMPTMKYLYPDPYYVDINELIYFNQNIPIENNIAHIRTYKVDVTNYNIRPARNKKWEARVDVESNWGRLWLTIFQERMSDGFRTSQIYKSFTYNKYNSSALSGDVLSNGINLSDIPHSQEKTLRDIQMLTNGSRQDKYGVEFEYTSPRIDVIRSSFIFNGAYYKSTYQNSQPIYEAPTNVIGGVVLKEKYVGIYKSRYGRENEQLNISLLCDTQMPKYGLI
ncbi:MAG: TonB-dependent receptor, partial [Bacteroidia bacterium]|nr:TonB-dependent receptor [Bacteroidia bacterium]